MAKTAQVINTRDLRAAIDRSTYGTSGRYVYGVTADGREVRITAIRVRPGIVYGYELQTGYYTPIVSWMER